MLTAADVAVVGAGIAALARLVAAAMTRTGDTIPAALSVGRLR
jgi:hypothetical protein